MFMYLLYTYTIAYIKARYSLTVLKVPLNPNSINQFIAYIIYYYNS